MKNITINILLLLFLGFAMKTPVSSQCPEKDETIKLNGQAEVDAFLMDNPNCEYIYELELTGDIFDLSGFSNLKNLDYLYFESCTALTDLSAFSNVDTIFDNLGFYNGMGFSNLCGLHNLKYIGGDLRLEETSGITTLHGLENLKTIGEDITIFENIDIKNLIGLENVASIGANDSGNPSIELMDNPNLEDCCGLKDLFEIFPNIEWRVENNLASCNSVMEIEMSDCNIVSSSCFSSATYSDLSQSIVVSPNPCVDYVRIINAETLNAKSVSLVNISGKITDLDYHNNGYLSLGENETGFYYLIISTNDKVISKKVFVLNK